MFMDRKIHLKHGSKIAVIGGGPAGTFFAHFAQHYARENKLDIAITIFDGKDFLEKGPGGCNMCAGVISETLLGKMKHIGIVLPPEKIQRNIDSYCLQTENYNLNLTYPSKLQKIHTVYRGNGPLDTIEKENVSFDEFLLRHCRSLGISVIHEYVEDIVYPENGKDAPVIVYGKGKKRTEADIIVGAFGLNPFAAKVEKLDFGYKVPKSYQTVQAEIKIDQEFIREQCANTINIFSLKDKRFRFAAFTPKKNHLTITLVGPKDLRKLDLLKFFNNAAVRKRLPEGWLPSRKYCHCHPRIPVTPGKNVYSDRLVMIGDAAFSRYYKNGIESAFQTARYAAESIFTYGISKSAFKKGYYRKAKKYIIRDNLYGRILFRIYDVIFKSEFLSSACFTLVASETRSYSVKRMQEILWNMYTGNIPYRKILVRLLTPRLVAKFSLIAVKNFFKQKVFTSSKKTAERQISSTIRGMGSLSDKQTVVIIGGGPSGVGCALTLQKIACERGIDLDIVLFEGKHYKGEFHYNQCLGVLSPPIEDIFKKELGVPFPHYIVQKKIEGYYLHSDNKKIKLYFEDEISYSVRRIIFDDYFLEQALKNGIRVIHSRVTGIERDANKVMIYSESHNIRADAVVGAFGLDDGTARIFERETDYRQPEFLESIVTKIHPGEKFISDFGTYIHAFLPSLRDVEFGAITPKGNHISINIAGKRVGADTMDTFLSLENVKRLLPPDEFFLNQELKYHKGRFPIRVANGIIGDRYIIIGDAAGMMRPFKGKGIITGILTGMRAAHTMMDTGISKQDLKEFHRKCRDITDDLPYGKALRFLTNLWENWKMMDILLCSAENNQELQKILFYLVSGQKTFKSIYHDDLSKKLAFKMFFGCLFKRIKGTLE